MDCKLRAKNCGGCPMLGIKERANYNRPKSENSRQPKCPPEKEKAIREALKHFGMI